MTPDTPLKETPQTDTSSDHDLSKDAPADNSVARNFPDDFIPWTPHPDLGSVSASEIIAMAWDDETSFDAIEAQTGLPEAQVIKLMRTQMKPSSFRMWRKRVSGRGSKHDLKR